MVFLEILQESTKRLYESGIANAGLEAEFIVSHCLGVDRAVLYRDNPLVPEKAMVRIQEFLNRRAQREPLQYILGYADFFGLKIRVGPGVLIPRPETELLAEESIKIISKFEIRNSKLTILDLCTGSGCIALALAKEFPEAQVYGTDTSEVALRYARENAGINNIGNVTFLRGSLYDPVNALRFDLITANPPYIKSEDIAILQPEVKDWEPREALEGGDDGLDYYRMIVPPAKGHLQSGGHIVLELGMDEAVGVGRIAEAEGFKDIVVKKDYAGIERIFIAGI
ncbi:MAG: peptide chain release factor N(5)-glutamine methyltransferase [Nitrospirota bacterium]